MKIRESGNRLQERHKQHTPPTERQQSAIGTQQKHTPLQPPLSTSGEFLRDLRGKKNRI